MLVTKILCQDQNLQNSPSKYGKVLRTLNIWGICGNGLTKLIILGYFYAGIDPLVLIFVAVCRLFMPPKELWEAYSNRTVRPSVRPAFVSGPYLLYSLG